MRKLASIAGGGAIIIGLAMQILGSANCQDSYPTCGGLTYLGNSLSISVILAGFLVFVWAVASKSKHSAMK